MDSVVDELVARGVDANSSVEGVPLLHFAIQRGHCHLISRLAECGADVNMQEPQFVTTPLMLATLQADVTASRILLEVVVIIL